MNEGILTRRRAVRLGLAACALALLGAGSAQADSLKVSGSDVVYNASGGAANSVSAMKAIGTSPKDGVSKTLVFVKSNITPSLGSGCAADAPGMFKCDAGSSPGMFYAYLDDKGDTSGQLVGGSAIAMHIEGQGGDDHLVGSSVGDYLEGGDGADTIDGAGGSDNELGRSGNDTIDDNGAGNDALDGGDGDDHLYGGDGNDTITGYYGKDVLKGEAGADKVDGSYDDDSLFGGSSFNDTSDTAVDKLYGGGGSDKLYSDDGLKETEIDCGESFLGSDKDEAYVDQLDKPFVTHCETVFVYQR
jgi:Ca2+-binding RTX toxin-like protein